MQLVPEVFPRCATDSRELALHILTTQQGKMQCRFHDVKRNTKGAKEADKLGFVVGVAYTKTLVPPPQGFMDCGCDENAALWEFMWFKTWNIVSKNPQVPTVDKMRPDANDVLSARQRAFFVQAYNLGTLLDVDDMYTVDPLFASDKHYEQLRTTQVHRMIFLMNQSLPKDSNWEYVLAKRTGTAVDKEEGDGDVSMT